MSIAQLEQLVRRKPGRWRVGTHYSIHIYERVDVEGEVDVAMGTMFTNADAQLAVEAVNALPKLLEVVRHCLLGSYCLLCRRALSDGEVHQPDCPIGALQ